jgi:hypothetical protein
MQWTRTFFPLRRFVRPASPSRPPLRNIVRPVLEEFEPRVLPSVDVLT